MLKVHRTGWKVLRARCDPADKFIPLKDLFPAGSVPFESYPRWGRASQKKYRRHPKSWEKQRRCWCSWKHFFVISSVYFLYDGKKSHQNPVVVDLFFSRYYIELAWISHIFRQPLGMRWELNQVAAWWKNVSNLTCIAKRGPGLVLDLFVLGPGDWAIATVTRGIHQLTQNNRSHSRIELRSNWEQLPKKKLGFVEWSSNMHDIGWHWMIADSYGHQSDQAGRWQWGLRPGLRLRWRERRGPDVEYCGVLTQPLSQSSLSSRLTRNFWICPMIPIKMMGMMGLILWM